MLGAAHTAHLGFLRKGRTPPSYNRPQTLELHVRHRPASHDPPIFVTMHAVAPVETSVLLLLWAWAAKTEPHTGVHIDRYVLQSLLRACGGTHTEPQLPMGMCVSFCYHQCLT